MLPGGVGGCLAVISSSFCDMVLQLDLGLREEVSPSPTLKLPQFQVTSEEGETDTGSMFGCASERSIFQRNFSVLSVSDVLLFWCSSLLQLDKFPKCSG